VKLLLVLVSNPPLFTVELIKTFVTVFATAHCVAARTNVRIIGNVCVFISQTVFPKKYASSQKRRIFL